jgi:hypothetical protein
MGIKRPQIVQSNPVLEASTHAVVVTEVPLVRRDVAATASGVPNSVRVGTRRR